MKRAPVLCAALLYAGCASAPPPEIRPQQPLPAAIHLDSPTQAISSDYDLVVSEGRLWLKGNEETQWQVAAPNGIPEPPGMSFAFNPPEKVVGVSADGDLVLVVDPGGKAYYADLGDYAQAGELTWVAEFGSSWTGERLSIAEGVKAFSISELGPRLGYSEDVAGKQHEVTDKVITLYSLAEDGMRILAADSRNPSSAALTFLTPLRGRFQAENLSASGSTLLVIDSAGIMYTRFVDFDSSGENPEGLYSYDPEDPRPERWSLPAEAWARQPRTPGRVTRDVTLVQTGQGNAAREIRVRGLDSKGVPGYYTKLLGEDPWRFVPVEGMVVDSAQLLGGESSFGPPLDTSYRGHLAPGREGHPPRPVYVTQFNPWNSPAKVEIRLGAVPFRGLLHFRRVEKTGKGHFSCEYGVLEVLPETYFSEDPQLRGFLKRRLPADYLHEVSFRLSANRRSLRLEQETDFGALRMRLLRHN